MRTITSIAIMASVLALIGAAAQTPPSAEQLLTKAKLKASEEHKSIFITFDASW